MGWFTILKLLITWGPKLFSLVSEIIDLINKGVDDPQAREALKIELKRIKPEVKATGDRRPLRELRDRIYSRRDGNPPGPRAA